MPQTVMVENSADEMPMAELADGLVAFITRNGDASGSLVGEAVIKAAGQAAIIRRGAGLHGGLIRQESMRGYYVRLMKPGETLTFSVVP